MCKFAIVDFRTKMNILEKLEGEGFIIIKSYENNNLYSSICGHVDISLFFSGNLELESEYKRFFVSARESFQYYKKIFEANNIDIPIFCGETELGDKYPQNIMYNVCFSGEYLIGNHKYTDNSIKNLLKGYKYVNVKQGYANCSILCLDKDNFITSDMGIYKALVRNGKNVLKIDEGDIDLDGLNYGFIGGVAGIFENTVYFTGDINTHCNSYEITEFIENTGKNIFNLSEERLYDYGGVYFFELL